MYCVVYIQFISLDDWLSSVLRNASINAVAHSRAIWCRARLQRRATYTLPSQLRVTSAARVTQGTRNGNLIRARPYQVQLQLSSDFSVYFRLSYNDTVTVTVAVARFRPRNHDTLSKCTYASAIRLARTHHCQHLAQTAACRCATLLGLASSCFMSRLASWAAFNAFLGWQICKCYHHDCSMSPRGHINHQAGDVLSLRAGEHCVTFCSARYHARTPRPLMNGDFVWPHEVAAERRTCDDAFGNNVVAQFAVDRHASWRAKILHLTPATLIYHFIMLLGGRTQL